MRRILMIAAVIFYSFTCFAQKDVTKFLGFPVDGTKSEMIKNLKSKGFKLLKFNGKEALTGRFNGNDVNVFIVTENDKVCRIMVCDANPVDETAIKIRYNRLCNQFKYNDKYISYDDYTIPENEDISYEMIVNNKRYDAVFYQKPEGERLEQLDTPNLKDAQGGDMREQLQAYVDDFQNKLELMVNTYNKPVWFMISSSYGKYYISMFYDNEYNRANGEDL